MKTYFLETDPPEQEFFEGEFADEDIQFCDTLDEVQGDAELLSIFIHSKIDTGFLDAHPALKLIATRSTTSDHIDLEECARRGVKVCGLGTYGDHTVPEHTFALLLAVCRKLRLAMESKSNRTFSYAALRSTELHGKTFGVIGAGRIGRQTLRLAKAFGMETIAYETSPDTRIAAETGFEYVTFEALLARAHFISINVPLTPGTFHMFNSRTFAKCRRGVVIINTARGRIIDTDALIEALNSGIVGGAGLDVLEEERVMRENTSDIISGQIVAHLQESFSPVEPAKRAAKRATELRELMQNSDLLAHPNVVFTPHIAYNSFEAMERINRATAESIKAFVAGLQQGQMSKNPDHGV